MAVKSIPLGNLSRTLFPWLYAPRPLPEPGVENYAFLSEYLNPQTPIGAGIANRRQYWFQTPTTIVSHVIGVQGIGGLIHGQFVGTPLTDVQSGSQFQ